MTGDYDGLLQIAKATKSGFQVVKKFESWRIAMIQCVDEDEKVSEVSKHVLSDESFILLEGRGYLITALKKDSAFEFFCTCLQPKTVYTVPKNTFHAHAFCSNATVLVVENADTCDANSEKISLDDQQKLMVSRLLPQI